MVAQQVKLLAYSSRIPRLNLFFLEFWFPSTAQKHTNLLTAYAKLPLSVNQCVNVNSDPQGLSQSGYRPIQVLPHAHFSLDRLQL